MHDSRRLALSAGSAALIALVGLLALPGFSLFTPGSSGMSTTHLLLEMVSVVVSVLVVAIAWHAFSVEDQRIAKTLIFAFSVVAGVDLIHALSYEGMPALGSPSGTAKAIFFWFMGRAFELLAVCLVALRVQLPGQRWYWQLGALLTIGLLFALGTWWLDWFPQTFVPGHGVTTFKAQIEWLLFAGNLLAAAHFWRVAQAGGGGPRDYYFSAACFVMGLGELTFTSYVEITDFVVIFGHLFKVAAYVLIYAGTFRLGMREPFERLQRSEQALRQKQAELDAVLTHVPAGVARLDREGRYLYVNDQMARRLGRPVADILGQPFEDIVAPHRRADVSYHWALAMAGKASGYEGQTQTEDGRVSHASAWIAPERDARDKVVGAIAVVTDITERKQAELKFQQMAYEDALTGLSNRHVFMDRLQQQLAMAERSGQYGALLFLDLDHFKDVNDTLGHEHGDELLRQVARRLRERVRTSDTVARLGGDEFVVLISELGENEVDATTQAGLLGEEILGRLCEPYHVAQATVNNTPSIGVVMYRGGQTRAEELLKQADIALYQAKGAGRNTLCFFDPAIQAAFEQRLALEADLRRALELGQFELHYQPVFNNRRVIVAAEALLRWRHPQRGMVPPGDFIALAEKSGLIVPIGMWVVEQACRQLATWRDDPARSTWQIAVNVSARQFQQGDFVAEVIRLIEQYGVSAGHLKLEITESSLQENLHETVRRMKELRARGVRFAIDDFGTGYSSLSYLKELPIHVLKIDRSFVSHVDTNDDDAAIAKTILSLAVHLGLDVVAEGIETETQFAALRAYGCPLFQGYLLGRPVPPDELVCPTALSAAPS